MSDVLRRLRSHLAEKTAGRELTDSLRDEIAGSAPSGGAEWRFCFPSLTRDPQDDGTLYLAADQLGERGGPKLLVFSASGPGEGESAGECEVRNFAPTDREAVRDFATRIEPRFLPRPQRAARSGQPQRRRKLQRDAHRARARSRRTRRRLRG